MMNKHLFYLFYTESDISGQDSTPNILNSK